jgi:IclR family transcriptional regulator, mhp operon transcriptional activator
MSYRHVRSLARGLQILTELTRIGRAAPSQLAAATRIDRTTVYRLLDTLEHEGFVAKTSDDRYAPTPAVRKLGEDFTDLDLVTRVVVPELRRLVTKVLWPTDFATFEQGAMVIRETTHKLSPFSLHRAMVGKKRPTLRSAMGRAVLSCATEQEREIMLRIIASSDQPDARQARDKKYVANLIRESRTRGYASAVGLVEPRIAAIALGVRSQERLFGAINLVFLRTAMTPAEAARLYLPEMRNTVRNIETLLRENA